MKYLITALLFTAASVSHADSIRVLNWSDYIDEGVLEQFTEQTGLEVDYVTFDDEEEFVESFFESELPWDLIIPSDNLLTFLMARDALQPIRKNRIEHYGELNKGIMRQLGAKDPKNRFAIPYMWGTTGIGINWSAAEASGISKTDDIDWSHVFNPAKRAPFEACGIVPVNERNEIFAAALTYAGFSINTQEKSELEAAQAHIENLAGGVKYFHSGLYDEYLGTGEACMVIGYSGDILATAYEYEDQDIAYYIPSQGTSVWYDVMAIPANARNADGAHQLINFFTSPEIAAANTDYNAYPNPLDSSMPFIDPEILEDETIYPSEAIMARLEGFAVTDKKTKRLKKKLWVFANCQAGAYCEVPISLYGDF
jgi:putrescine transport system substrate-binding protein